MEWRVELQKGRIPAKIEHYTSEFIENHWDWFSAKNIHLTDICNQHKGEINNNNNSTSSTDPKSKIQQEKNKSEKEIFVFNWNATQNTKVEFY